MRAFCCPSLFEPREIISLGWQDALSKADQTIKHLRAVPLALGTSSSRAPLAELVHGEGLDGALGLQRWLRFKEGSLFAAQDLSCLFQLGLGRGEALALRAHLLEQAQPLPFLRCLRVPVAGKRGENANIKRDNIADPPCFIPLLFDYFGRQRNGAKSLQLCRNCGIIRYP
jgi:hypothetical protein